VQKNEIDIAISTITITPERQADFLFSVPYFEGGQAIVVKKDFDKIKSLNDIKAVRVGVGFETTAESATVGLVKPEFLIRYKDFDSHLKALKDGEIEAAVFDLISISDIIKNNPDLTQTGGTFSQEFYGIMSNKNNIELIDQINRILRQLKRNGEINSLKSNWL
jgi:ABC-type amino acid transport substrate-binding protein